jgi:serine/threonine-protein kinase
MVGRKVGQYQFLEKLGAGGMGEIYKAQDTRLGRFVAIKVLPSAKSGDPERRRRFLQEAQAASGLNHPNIITTTTSSRKATPSSWSWNTSPAAR